jgi:hypothetical protein
MAPALYDAFRRSPGTGFSQESSLILAISVTSTYACAKALEYVRVRNDLATLKHSAQQNDSYLRNMIAQVAASSSKIVQA